MGRWRGGEGREGRGGEGRGGEGREGRGGGGRGGEGRGGEGRGGGVGGEGGGGGEGGERGGEQCFCILSLTFDGWVASLLQGFSESEISFAKATFSNLLGGISYFYGQSQ